MKIKTKPTSLNLVYHLCVNLCFSCYFILSGFYTPFTALLNPIWLLPISHCRLSLGSQTTLNLHLWHLCGSLQFATSSFTHLSPLDFHSACVKFPLREHMPFPFSWQFPSKPPIIFQMPPKSPKFLLMTMLVSSLVFQVIIIHEAMIFLINYLSVSSSPGI